MLGVLGVGPGFGFEITGVIAGGEGKPRAIDRYRLYIGQRNRLGRDDESPGKWAYMDVANVPIRADEADGSVPDWPRGDCSVRFMNVFVL